MCYENRTKRYHNNHLDRNMLDKNKDGYMVTLFLLLLKGEPTILDHDSSGLRV